MTVDLPAPEWPVRKPKLALGHVKRDVLEREAAFGKALKTFVNLIT